MINGMIYYSYEYDILFIKENCNDKYYTTRLIE